MYCEIPQPYFCRIVGIMRPPCKKMRLTVILPTEASLEVSEQMGMLSRWQFYFRKLTSEFNVDVYSYDVRDFSNILGITHHTMPYGGKSIRYVSQFLYNIWLAIRAKKMANVLRVFSASYFILPFIAFFRKKMILSYQYDYKTRCEKDFGGIKGMTAGLREFLSVKSARIVLCTTNELQAKIKNSYGLDSILIPNFVDTHRFQVRDDKEDYILYAGRIHWAKGIHTLIAAFSSVAREYRDFRLIIAGLGEIDRYKATAANYGTKNIEFVGVVDHTNMPELMGRAKIFILPTLHREGHPKALIEAMACGCACIATDVPGNRELLRAGEIGLLFSPGDDIALAETVLRILSDRYVLSLVLQLLLSPMTYGWLRQSQIGLPV